MKNDFIIKNLYDIDGNIIKDQLGNIAIYAFRTFDGKEDGGEMLSMTVYPENIDGAKEKAMAFVEKKAIERLAQIEEIPLNSNDVIRSQINSLYVETEEEKIVDRKEAQEVLYNGRFLVNITTDGSKKIATIHDNQTTSIESIELDEERGDKFFDTIEEAKKYAESFA